MCTEVCFLLTKQILPFILSIAEIVYWVLLNKIIRIKLSEASILFRTLLIIETKYSKISHIKLSACMILFIIQPKYSKISRTKLSEVPIVLRNLLIIEPKYSKINCTKLSEVTLVYRTLLIIEIKYFKISRTSQKSHMV